MGLRVTYRQVWEAVAAAAIKAGRQPSDVTLVVISKGRTPDRIMELYDQGVRDFGENRAQELARKAAGLPGDIRWHFVGPLQTNKVKMVRPHAHLLHSMDRVKLAGIWARDADRPIPALVQINIGEEPQKHGVAPDDAHDMVERLASEGAVLKGLMGMAPQVPDPELVRPLFRRLRRLSEGLRERHPTMGELSMGMTEDYQVAVEEGATMVRIGRAVFGEAS